MKLMIVLIVLLLLDGKNSNGTIALVVTAIIITAIAAI